MEQTKKGKFIVFEGIDGCGKTFHCKNLTDYLNSIGIETAQTCEPTKDETGLLLRRYLSGELKTSPEGIAGMFVADRINHITKPEGLLDLLNSGVNVVCDRYFLSSIAYNAQNHTPEWVYNLNKPAVDLLSPDLVVYLEMPSFKEDRISTRDVKEIYETSEYQKKVKERYNEAFRLYGGPLVKISSNRDKKDVVKDVRHEVLKLFK